MKIGRFLAELIENNKNGEVFGSRCIVRNVHIRSVCEDKSYESHCCPGALHDRSRDHDQHKYTMHCVQKKETKICL